MRSGRGYSRPGHRRRSPSTPKICHAARAAGFGPWLLREGLDFFPWLDFFHPRTKTATPMAAARPRPQSHGELEDVPPLDGEGAKFGGDTVTVSGPPAAARWGYAAVISVLDFPESFWRRRFMFFRPSRDGNPIF